MSCALTVRLLPPAAAGFAFLAALGMSPEFPSLSLLGPGVIAACLVALAFGHPQSAPTVATAIPLVETYLPISMLLVAGIGLMLIAIARCWPRADAPSRRGALLVALLGTVTLVIGVGYGVPGAGSGGTALAVAYATLVGVCAAIVRPGIAFLTVSVALLGATAGIAALTSPALHVSRDTVVLGENANGLGFIAALGIVAGLVLCFSAAAPARLLGCGVAIACAMGLIVTGSRGSFLAGLAGAGTLAIHRMIRTRPVLALGVTVAVIGLLGFASGPLTNRFAQAAGRQVVGIQANTTSREDALAYAVQQGMAHPVLGVGLGELAQHSLTDPASGLGLRAHDVYAGAFAESGAGALIALVAVSLSALLRARRHSPERLMPMVVTVIVGGLSLEWWGAGRTGPLAMLVLGAALGAGADGSRSAGPAPVSTDDGDGSAHVDAAAATTNTRPAQPTTGSP